MRWWTARSSSDGALSVSEKITFDFHGSFSGAYRDIPLGDDETFENIGVREGADDFTPGASTELGSFGLPGTFGAVATRDDQGRKIARIVWHYSASDEPRTFQITYRIRGLTRVHRDAVDVFWQVWGDNWKGSLDRLDATLTLPPNVPEGSERIWGHPGSVQGTVTRQGRRIVLAAAGIPREQFVELRALLPRSALSASPTAARVDDEVAFDKIVAAEQADFDSAAAGYRNLQRVLDDTPARGPRRRARRAGRGDHPLRHRIPALRPRAGGIRRSPSPTCRSRPTMPRRRWRWR